MTARAPLAEWRNALRDSKLDSTSKLVGFVISTFFRSDGSGAFASKTTIAAGASLRSQRAVYTAVRRLADAGFLSVSVSKGRSSNGYAATLPTMHPGAPLEPGTPEHGSALNRASDDTQPCTGVPLTMHPGAHKGVESVESDARPTANGSRRAWLDNFGVHYAHDAEAFREEACRMLGVDATEAESLRLELQAKDVG